MKPTFFFLMIMLLLNPVLVRAQNDSKGDQNNDPRKEIAVTGCLTKNSLKEFDLVDEKGIDNLLYSEVVNLDNMSDRLSRLSGSVVQRLAPTWELRIRSLISWSTKYNPNLASAKSS